MTINVTKYRLNPDRIFAGTRGSYGMEKLSFDFGDGWDFDTISVTFHPQRGKPIRVPLLPGVEIDIPAEVMEHSGETRFVVSGRVIGEDGAIERQAITLEGYVDVAYTADEKGGNTRKITPDVYDQLIDQASKVFNEAREDVEQSATEAEESAKRAEDAAKNINSVAEKANEAIKAAEEAKNAKKAAEQSASNANSAKDTAVTAAEAAQKSANSAAEAKNAAENSANSAGRSAQEAQSAASEAAKQKYEAESAAARAEEAAEEAEQAIKDAVKSVNGVLPDENGNVEIELPEGGGTGDGYSPEAKVERVEGGVRVTITDKDGTTSEVVQDGKPGVHVGSDAPPAGTRVWVNPNGKRTEFPRIDDTLTTPGYAADAAKVGRKFEQISEAIANLEGAINGVKTWDYTEGLPEVDGYEYVGTQGKAVMQSNGVSLSAGAQYNFPFANAPESEIEFKFTITKKSSSYWGFVVIVSNGTNGIRLSMQNGAFYFCENTSNNIKVADISENAEHTLKVDFFDTAKADVYLDGVKIITNSISYPTYTTTLFQQNGSGTTVLHSITYRIPEVEREYIPVPETAAVGQTIVVESVDENGKPTVWKAKDFPSGTDDGGGTDASLGITGAAVGQIPQVSAVDESGVPTAWLPADFPSGGGSGEWELLEHITLTEDVRSISVNVPEGTHEIAGMFVGRTNDSEDSLTTGNSMSHIRLGGNVNIYKEHFAYSRAEGTTFKTLFLITIVPSCATCTVCPNVGSSTPQKTYMQANLAGELPCALSINISDANLLFKKDGEFKIYRR